MFFHLRVRTRAAAILRLVAPIALVSAILTSPGVGAKAGSVDVFHLVPNIRGGVPGSPVRRYDHRALGQLGSRLGGAGNGGGGGLGRGQGLVLQRGEHQARRCVVHPPGPRGRLRPIAARDGQSRLQADDAAESRGVPRGPPDRRSGGVLSGSGRGFDPLHRAGPAELRDDQVDLLRAAAGRHGGSQPGWLGRRPEPGSLRPRGPPREPQRVDDGRRAGMVAGAPSRTPRRGRPRPGRRRCTS